MSKQTATLIPRFCAECERQLPTRSHHQVCASCRKRAAGLIQVTRRVPVIPGGRMVFIQRAWERAV